MSSTSQDIPDSILLASLGLELLHAIVEVCTMTLIYGVFVVLFSQATMTYSKREGSSRIQHWMFFTCAFTFLLATIDEATVLANTGILVYSALVKYQDLALAERPLRVNALMKNPNIILGWLSAFEVIISDCIVVWRASVLLQDRWWLITFPLFLLLASVASLLGASGVWSIGNNIYKGGIPDILYQVGLGMSLGTNILATALIGYRYWVHRKMVAGLRRNGGTRSERVLALLVESGIVFCLPQAANFMIEVFPQFSIPGTAGYYLLTIFTTAYLGFSTIYPTVVIALVNSQKSFDQVYLIHDSLPTISSGASPGHMTTIRFAYSNPVSDSRMSPQGVEKSVDT
ncbi:hypothetical protein BDZ94DRAFT_1303196 [Collybia nuda]|uniref:Uncharacterized protein n=1 Tax=Collybia nuda TaxID=64659 RepID=A0A9P5YIE3_9AGAR|nr:hypothetical protein BDZ94DRAFT_1303196 [Collybia nuda]